MKSKLVVGLLALFIGKQLIAQRDTSAYTLFSDSVVWYTDLGYSAAPFSMIYDFSSDISKLAYKNNFRAILGVGVCYKWFSLRLGIPLPSNMRPVSRYGTTTPYDIGFDFSFKKNYFDVDIRNYRGYAIKNAYKWEDTLNELRPNDIRPNTSALSFSINSWYFHNPNLKMQALRGKTGHYNEEVQTWYIKSTFNIFGIGNDYDAIVPTTLINSDASILQSNTISALDIGIVPGYAYVNRINNFQFSILGGLGAVLQGKFHFANGVTYAQAGFAPRYDIKLIGGYSRPDRFLFLVTDFDNKSVNTYNLIYRQHFYNIKLVAGIRI